MQESRRKDIRRTAAVVREKCKDISLYDIHSGKTLILDLL